MSLGTLPRFNTERPNNLVYFILDSEVYESTGSQPFINSRVDLAQIGRSCRYRHLVRVEEIEASRES